MNRWTLLVLAVAACDVVDPSDWQPVSYLDEGEVCFVDADPDVTVHVTAQDCMSSSCSRGFGGECTAVVKGTDITLTSDIHWEQDMGDVACTDDCGIPTVTCTIPDLADGTYTVTFGGETLTLTVPIVKTCTPY